MSKLTDKYNPNKTHSPLLKPLQDLLAEAEEVAGLAYRATASTFKQTTTKAKELGTYITPEITQIFYDQIKQAQQLTEQNLDTAVSRLINQTRQVMMDITESNIPDNTAGRHLAKQIVLLMLNQGLYDAPQPPLPPQSHPRHLPYQPYITTLKGMLPVVDIRIEKLEPLNTYDISVSPRHTNHEYQETVNLEPAEVVELQRQLDRFLIQSHQLTPTLLRIV